MYEDNHDLPAGQETVLVVEDAPAVRELAVRVLRQQGYTVLEAEDSATALRLAQEYAGSIHLLLSDMVMPGVNGKVLADQLAQIRPGLRILFMSGYTDNAIVQHGVLAPGVAFLPKPFTTLALARKVREVLDSPDPKGL
jgi:CheY-like chemotaxis protein